MPRNKEIYTLHRYFIWADRMRAHFDQVLEDKRLEPKRRQIDQFLYLSYWYGGMYVVIEGWKELKFSDPSIDQLLKSPNVDLLKKYRNGVFHFQKEYFDNRFREFLKNNNTVIWIRNLREVFSRFFLKHLQNNI